MYVRYSIKNHLHGLIEKLFIRQLLYYTIEIILINTATHFNINYHLNTSFFLSSNYSFNLQKRHNFFPVRKLPLLNLYLKISKNE
ncbi:putative membrane protein YdbT with pleckstrin-like domain [Spirosoma lacussanchae]